jgi:hypothetical protein
MYEESRYKTFKHTQIIGLRVKTIYVYYICKHIINIWLSGAAQQVKVK